MLAVDGAFRSACGAGRKHDARGRVAIDMREGGGLEGGGRDIVDRQYAVSRGDQFCDEFLAGNHQARVGNGEAMRPFRGAQRGIERHFHGAGHHHAEGCGNRLAAVTE